MLHRLASHNVAERDQILVYSDVLLLWSRVITFGKYIGHPSTALPQRGSLTAIHTYLSYAENPSPGLGTEIARAVCPSLLSCNPEDSKFGSAIHAVLVSELQLFSTVEDRVSHLQYIVTTYLVFTHSSTSDRASADILFSAQN